MRAQAAMLPVSPDDPSGSVSGPRALVRADAGWVPLALVPASFRVPDEDGLILVRSTRPSSGEKEFIGVYSRALVRVAIRFAEANGVPVVVHWRGTSTADTGLALALACWLCDTRAAAGQPAAVVTSARRPDGHKGVVAIAHALRQVDQSVATIWELRSAGPSAPTDSPTFPMRSRPRQRTSEQFGQTSE
ncbi:MAG: hypothetical protein IRZ08_04035 [Frankia sp.]|nr:hypothetical protein [Frankia sp.]